MNRPGRPGSSHGHSPPSWQYTEPLGAELIAMQACPWCEGFDLYRDYHDSEWGVPLYDDRSLFELLILEGAQAGLSWATILKKRGKLSPCLRWF